jgi:hypothetical protein
MVALEAGAQSDLATATALESVSTVACFLTDDGKARGRSWRSGRPSIARAGTTGCSAAQRPSAQRGESARTPQETFYEICFMGCPQQLPDVSETCPHFSQRYFCAMYPTPLQLTWMAVTTF